MNHKLLTAAIGLVLLVSAGVYVASRAGQRRETQSNARPATAVIAAPFVMFRTLAPRDLHGRVAMMRVREPDLTRFVAPLSCARVAYAAGSGVCLIEEAVGTTLTHAAYVFDSAFTTGPRIELQGTPTRVRISPDGRRAGITVYGEEHLPSGDERLAISSVIVDVGMSRVIGDLREFALDRNGASTLSGPLDFSSISFAGDSNEFFATLSTPTERYIIRGRVDDRRMTVITTGLASEGLSPDQSRLVVKKRVGDRGFWQLLVLELGTHNTRQLNHDNRSVDDQVEWLDRDHVVYHDATDQGTNVWLLAADGVSPPRLLIADAYSPSVQH